MCAFFGTSTRRAGVVRVPDTPPEVPIVSAKVQAWVWDQDLLPQRKLLLLWLANRATDAGVCFPSKRELAEQTGLGERMVRYHLAWLASDRDDDGQPKVPLLQIIERPKATVRAGAADRVDTGGPDAVHVESPHSLMIAAYAVVTLYLRGVDWRCGRSFRR